MCVCVCVCVTVRGCVLACVCFSLFCSHFFPYRGFVSSEAMLSTTNNKQGLIMLLIIIINNVHNLLCVQRRLDKCSPKTVINSYVCGLRVRTFVAERT